VNNDIQVFTDKQNELLNETLDERFVSTRKGGGNMTLRYLEGHDAIDQGNRIFGYGNWSYRPLSCEQTVLIDPVTGEAVGVTYKAQVELIVRGCVAPIVDVGSQPVSTWNVDDHIWSVREKDAKYKKVALDTSDFTRQEKTNARRAITDAHEMAEKGAVTDALKRALRTYGNQFGNGLYGDGPVVIVDGDTLTIEDLKNTWSQAYKITAAQVEQRWPKYIVHILGTSVINPDAHQKALLFADIDRQRRVAKLA
jgi:hypothetical protein